MDWGRRKRYDVNNKRNNDMQYHALAVRQPDASLIAVGEKTIECRSRRWNYRGPVIICASARPVIAANPDNPKGPKLPTGAAICVVDMVDCRPFMPGDVYPACLENYTYDTLEGCFAWVLENPREIVHMPVKSIVAPWPWKGPEPVLNPGWHDAIGF